MIKLMGVKKILRNMSGDAARTENLRKRIKHNILRI